ncbi:MAG: hypothetical protein HC879_05440 [Leptolyngbyaceae cyanobacterium SL_5_9]|nr:hypothetical protein [Leptolyngbyaceae cyanobacterium SL_5_9]
MAQAAKEMPGRPREFDCEATLAKAVDVFWEYGFSRITYALLEQATGLHRQSIVYAFGDKKRCFRLCYVTMQKRECRQQLIS